MRSWMVRLGKFGEMEPRALDTGELVTGWKLSDLSSADSREKLQQIIAADEPDRKPGTTANWAAQLNQLLNVMSPGDLVIVPLKSTGNLAIGEVQGAPFQTKEGNPSRHVKWLRTDLPRQNVKQDLLYSLGATQTVCEVSRNEATLRFKATAMTGKDPGPNIVPTKSGNVVSIDTNEATDAQIDIAQTARDQIERHISAHFAGHSFTNLIAAILRAQGYRTQVSPPGPDRSIDILAGQGALGFDGPRLVVQVKSGDIVVDQPTLQSLIGCIADTRAEHGLLVAWSGFKSTVTQRANELYFRVRLWDRSAILDALFSVYDKLPEDIRAELPLQRVWAVVPQNEEA
jgi:restriction system protein